MRTTVRMFSNPIAFTAANGGWMDYGGSPDQSKYVPVRDDAKRHHPGLRPWSELAADQSDFVGRARLSLVSVLLCLRSLGYRSVPKVAQQEAGGILKDVV